MARIHTVAACSAAVHLSVVAPALAVNVGDQDNFEAMSAKLASEGQVEMVSAITGKLGDLKGVKFYYDPKSREGYITINDDPSSPQKMKIYAKLLSAEIYNASAREINPKTAFADKRAGIDKCKELTVAGKVKAEDCSSLNAVLIAHKSQGTMVIQQGEKPNGNIMTVLMNTDSTSAFFREGAVFESTPEGATILKFPFANASYTANGSSLVNKPSR